jgi:hypothetical protein
VIVPPTWAEWAVDDNMPSDDHSTDVKSAIKKMGKIKKAGI